MLIPGWVLTGLRLPSPSSLLSFLRVTVSHSFLLSCSVSHLPISPGAALPSQTQDLGPASVGITYFEALAFLLKNT